MVPVQNVYYLLCYAWERLEENPATDVGALACEKVEDLLAHVLIAGATRLLRRGLDRAYVEFHDELRAPRGKFNLAASMKRSLERASRAACTYDELDSDVLHNRLLKATLLRLAAAGVSPVRARELTLAARRMRDVTDVVPSPALFQRVQLHRNNAHYRFLLHVCELVARCSVPHLNGQGYRFNDFRANEQEMGALFEAFVRNFLQREQRHFKVGRETISWKLEPVVEGTQALLPVMRTDLSLVAPGRKVILDTKFYRSPLRVGQDGRRKLRESHLYQVFAYLKNLEGRGEKQADAAVLLYASTGEHFDLRYRLGSYELRAVSLDLDRPWQSIHAALLQLAEGLRAPLPSPARAAGR